MIPLETVSIRSVRESYERIFLQNRTNTSLPFTQTFDECSKLAEADLDLSEKSEGEWIRSLSLDEQIQRFCALDYNQLDYQNNHFGLWAERMKKIIISELVRLQKLIFFPSIALFLFECKLEEKHITVIKDYLNE